MPITPIDLQTMFVRQAELSRQQAALHDGAVQKAAVDMAESAEETKEADDKVQRSQEVSAGPEKTKEDKEANKEPGTAPHRKRKTVAKQAEEPEPPPPEPEVIRDPKLGSRIDISG